MYGEKEEQVAELKLDLQDVTQLYKAQLDELVRLKQRAGRQHAEGGAGGGCELVSELSEVGEDELVLCDVISDEASTYEVEASCEVLKASCETEKISHVEKQTKVGVGELLFGTEASTEVDRSFCTRASYEDDDASISCKAYKNMQDTNESILTHSTLFNQCVSKTSITSCKTFQSPSGVSGITNKTLHTPYQVFSSSNKTKLCPRASCKASQALKEPSVTSSLQIPVKATFSQTLNMCSNSPIISHTPDLSQVCTNNCTPYMVKIGGCLVASPDMI